MSKAAARPRARAVHLHGVEGAVEARVFDRDGTAPGFSVAGPAIVEEAQSATFVPPGMQLDVGASGELMIRRL